MTMVLRPGVLFTGGSKKSTGKKAKAPKKKPAGKTKPLSPQELLKLTDKYLKPSEVLLRPVQRVVTEGVEKANQSFAVGLLRELKEEALKNNLVFSPLSVWNALMLLVNGAEGGTREQIQKSMNLGDLVKKGATLEQITQANKDAMESLKKIDNIDLRNAYSIWAREGSKFTKTYLDRIQALSAESGTFAKGDPSPVNQWADKNTNGMIKKVLSPDEVKDAIAVLVNAIYMKAPWVLPFKKEQTRPMPFEGTQGTTQPNVMRMFEQRFKYTETVDAQVLNLPYGRKDEPGGPVVNQLSMTVFLPKKKDGLADLYARLTDQKSGKEPALYSEIKDVLQARQPKVVLSFPRFKNALETDLNPVLKALGMDVVFSDFADFTKMVEGESLKVSKAKQNAVIDVTEEGTEAAAVTTIGMVRTTSIRLPEPVVVFNADHPFLYAIHDNSGQVLFVGTVNNLENAK